MQKYVFNFLDEVDSLNFTKKNLGTKGYNLFTLSKEKINVPEGFTISSKVSKYYFANNNTLPKSLNNEILKNISKLEAQTSKKFGEIKKPLLVSVRSGSEVSMPGMMDTILNLGMNDKITEGFARQTSIFFAYDCYLRFIHMFSDVVLGLDYEILEREKKSFLNEINSNFEDLSQDHFKELVNRFKKTIQNNAIEFPEDPFKQLELAVISVINSWNSQRAVIYRKINNIDHDIGTAVTVQSMVFGNLNDDSYTGVLFTRNPINGNKKIFGEYIQKAQGEDIVSGKKTPLSITDGENSLKSISSKLYEDLIKTCQKLEKFYGDMQDVEFTIENKQIYILQTRSGKRSALASVILANNFVEEGYITKKEALLRIDPVQIDQLLHPAICKSDDLKLLGSGLAASPGAAYGKIVFTSEDAEKYSKKYKVILIRNDTCPNDIKGMSVSQGIITARGGLTSHAAVVARGMGIPCISGASTLNINIEQKTVTIGSHKLKELDEISFDGSSGEIFLGKAKVENPIPPKEFDNIIAWSDEFRKLRVRANSETEKDTITAMNFGAEGIGLCRTEHMFFEKEKISLFRQIILTESEEDRFSILQNIEKHHTIDFQNIFKIIKGKPINIRLLDPPLHEFLPKTSEEIDELATEMNLSSDYISEILEKLDETNPMLGHRGARLGITHTDIYRMQIRSIINAAIIIKKQDIPINIEIMLPLISNEHELIYLKNIIMKEAEEIFLAKNEIIQFKLGTMIELPRATVISDKIAKNVDYFSYGTNDLTQTIYGISRDDISSFLNEYLLRGIFKEDPFVTIDEEGVGEAIILSLKKGKKANISLSSGICGEHGGDPKSIHFFNKIGLSYISCSPYRIPVAKIAAAQAEIMQNQE